MATADAHGAQRGEMRVPNQRRRVLQVRHRSERERSSDGVPGARSAGDGGRALPAYDVHAVPCATSASCKFSRGLTRLGLSHLRGAAMCQLRDDAPTVARATIRPGVVRQPFSWRVRRYPVSLVRRTLHKAAHPPERSPHIPRTLEQRGACGGPSHHHYYTPSTVVPAPVRRSNPSTRQSP